MARGESRNVPGKLEGYRSRLKRKDDGSPRQLSSRFPMFDGRAQCQATALTGGFRDESGRTFEKSLIARTGAFGGQGLGQSQTLPSMHAVAAVNHGTAALPNSR